MNFEILGLLVRVDEEVKLLSASGWLAGEVPSNDPRLDHTVESLGLRTQPRKTLRAAGFATVRDLLTQDFTRVPGIGTKSKYNYAKEVDAALQRLGLHRGTKIAE
ncbi:hypothetical protein HY970_02215 [Candidatus Kaiserbacteria bacterium]|nr:hypothetical protein [Candidatus Kaiserbacteria bacterium]